MIDKYYSSKINEMNVKITKTTFLGMVNGVTYAEKIVCFFNDEDTHRKWYYIISGCTHKQLFEKIKSWGAPDDLQGDWEAFNENVAKEKEDAAKVLGVGSDGANYFVKHTITRLYNNGGIAYFHIISLNSEKRLMVQIPFDLVEDYKIKEYWHNYNYVCDWSKRMSFNQFKKYFVEVQVENLGVLKNMPIDINKNDEWTNWYKEACDSYLNEEKRNVA